MWKRTNSFLHQNFPAYYKKLIELTTQKETRFSQIFDSEQLKNPWGLLLYFLIVVVIFSRRPEMLVTPYLFAEDGSVFLNRALNNGLSSLLIPYNGYFHFIPQFVSLIAVGLADLGLGFLAGVHFMVWFSVLFAAGMIGYFCSDNFSWVVPHKWIRFLICCGIILMSMQETYSVWFTNISAQWWAGFFLFLSGLDIIKKEKNPTSWSMIAILTLIGLSTPMIGLLFLSMTYIILSRILSKSKAFTEKSEWICIVMLLSTVIIQGYAFYINDRILVSTETRTFVQSLEMMFSNITYRIPQVVVSKFILSNFRFIVGLLSWVLILVFLLKIGKKLTAYFFAFLIGLVIMMFIGGGSVNSYYVFTPQGVFLFLFFIAAYHLSTIPKMAVISVLIIGILLPATFSGRLIKRLSNDSFLKEYANLYDHSSNEYVISIIPPHFTCALNLPVNINSQFSAIENKNEFEIEKKETIEIKDLATSANIGIPIDDIGSWGPYNVISIQGHVSDPQDMHTKITYFVKINDKSLYYCGKTECFLKNGKYELGINAFIPTKFFEKEVNNCELLILNHLKKNYYRIPFQIALN